MITASEQRAENEPVNDSRYRSIIGQLDAMIELIRLHPLSTLTADLDNVLDAITRHISSEDTFMELVGFPQYPKHSQHHRVIYINTAERFRRIGKSQDVLLEDLTFINQLWREHIRIHDRALEEFLS